jgi:hypothetical protein
MSRNERTELEAQITRDLGALSCEPVRACRYIWPGLELRAWQVEWMEEIGQCLRFEPHQPIRTARASGHGIGKSSGIALLSQALTYTHENTRGVITANTATQLSTKTWPEFAKWYGCAISIIRDWFELTATALHRKGSIEVEKAWRVDAIPWSEHNAEAFQGLHNKGRRIVLAYDEASAIADSIWTASQGALTDEGTEIIWAAMGNPTRTEGGFRDCFGRNAHRWRGKHIDSRDVPGAINMAEVARWVQDYGEDSDFVRVRVRGMFPRASSLQFIDQELVEAAATRIPIAGLRDPLIMSIDVARGGSAEYVIAFRRGLDARSIPWVIIPGSEARDSMRVITKVVDLATTEDRFSRPDAIFVDETGVGGPIVDRLRQLLGDDNAQVYGVNFGEGSPNPKQANIRMYIYWKLRDALRGGLCIPNDPALHQQLCGPEYHHNKRDQMILEEKEAMQTRLGIWSDRADALACGYLLPVMPRQSTAVMGTQHRAKSDYDPYNDARA